MTLQCSGCFPTEGTSSKVARALVIDCVHNLQRGRWLNTGMLFLMLSASSIFAPTKSLSGQAIIRFSSGDSVLILGSGPLNVPGRQSGLLIEFDPFIDVRDTVDAKTSALAVWRVLRTNLDTLHLGFVVLRATDRVPTDTTPQHVHMYGVVVEKRKNGMWYIVGDSVTVDAR
jgi:hypothetical protein